MKNTFIFNLFSLTILLPFFAKAQDSTLLKPPCEQKDLRDMINSFRKHPTTPKPEKTSSLLLIPSISSSPATGISAGVGGQYTFSGKKAGSRYSIINGGATVTTKRQLMVSLKNNIFLKEDKVFLSGDWRFYIFSQPTFGLGTHAPEGGLLEQQYTNNGWTYTGDSLKQPMKYNLVRFHQTISFQVSKSIFAGFGYQLDCINHIVDQKLDTLRPLYSSHYLYSNHYGFDKSSYLVSGISLNASLDTRDNLVNAYKGVYANFSWRLNPTFMGNKKNAQLLNLEWRSFHRLSALHARHLIAFWMLGTFGQTGKLPYLTLPAHGYDQRGRSGRGYTQGRFRGTSLVYGETEYRFPISACSGILGGVVFANVTTASYKETNEQLFDKMAPGYGLGLRMMVDKKSKTNLLVDVGFGKKSHGVYFGASETF